MNLRKPQLLFGSTEKQSALTISYTETDNIKFTYDAEPKNQKILPGENVEYTLNISSTYEDSISLDIQTEETGEWDVSIQENTPLSIKEKGTKQIHITVTSTDNTQNAYDNTIDLTFIVQGNTGIDEKTASVEVTRDVIKYNVEIIGYTKNKNIKRGNNGTFYFVIQNKNTGAIDDTDSYDITVKSEHNWNLQYFNTIKNVQIGEQTGPEDIPVIISVPDKTTITKDIITFTVTSQSDSATSQTINVTVTVLAPTLLESIYDFFESASDELGLTDLFDEQAPLVLATLILIIIFFIIIILALILTKKTIQLICTDRIKEIDPNETATFTIILRNPTKKPQTYQLTANTASNPNTKWNLQISETEIQVQPKSTHNITIQAIPTEQIQPSEWTELLITAKPKHKRKTISIRTVITIKEGKPILQIQDVFTWPENFQPGERITTSFKVSNKGTISAKNVKIALYINNKQKSKVEVTIPSNGYADIKMPWIAQKGKNKLRIKIINYINKKQ